MCLLSETSASSVLKSAKMLRRSEDPSIASQVYINPDLSPADSKIAFERRQRKRQSRQGNQIAQSTTYTTTTGTTDDRVNQAAGHQENATSNIDDTERTVSSPHANTTVLLHAPPVPTSATASAPPSSLPDPDPFQ